MAFSANTERRHLADVERHLATADTCIEARIELLQRMPIFGGIRADILQFLLGLCPVVSVLHQQRHGGQDEQEGNGPVPTQHPLRLLEPGDAPDRGLRGPDSDG